MEESGGADKDPGTISIFPNTPEMPIYGRFIYILTKDETNTSLPDTILKFERMMSLTIIAPNMKSLHPDLYTIRNLDTVSLESGGYIDAPNDLLRVTQLRYLSLTSTKMRMFSKHIPIHLADLKILVLQRNLGMRRISSGIGWLQRLKHLAILESPQLTSLPRSIGYLGKLDTLELVSCGLESLPDSIGLLDTLTVLNARDNKLLVIPYTIGKLTALRDLKLSKNRLQAIHPSLTHLTQLRSLALQENQIASIPDTLQRLTNLRYINISNNPPLRYIPAFFLNVPNDRTHAILWPNHGLEQELRNIQTEPPASSSPSLREQHEREDLDINAPYILSHQQQQQQQQRRTKQTRKMDQETLFVQPQSLVDIVSKYIHDRLHQNVP